MSNRKSKPKIADPWLEVSAKLDTLIRLSALNIVKDLKTQKEKISFLSDAAFTPKAIAGVLRATENTVNVALHGIRKERATKENKEGLTAQSPEKQESEEGKQIGEEKTASPS